MDRCITVSYGKVKGAARKYSYFQPAVYSVYEKKDGKKVWKYENHIGTARRSFNLAKADAKEYAKQNCVSFLPNIRQWSPKEVGL